MGLFEEKEEVSVESFLRQREQEKEQDKRALAEYGNKNPNILSKDNDERELLQDRVNRYMTKREQQGGKGVFGVNNGEQKVEGLDIDIKKIGFFMRLLSFIFMIMGNTKASDALKGVGNAVNGVHNGNTVRTPVSTLGRRKADTRFDPDEIAYNGDNNGIEGKANKAIRIRNRILIGIFLVLMTLCLLSIFWEKMS